MNRIIAKIFTFCFNQSHISIRFIPQIFRIAVLIKLQAIATRKSTPGDISYTIGNGYARQVFALIKRSFTKIIGRRIADRCYTVGNYNTRQTTAIREHCIVDSSYTATNRYIYQATAITERRIADRCYTVRNRNTL